jgi:hypothetical protein
MKKGLVVGTEQREKSLKKGLVVGPCTTLAKKPTAERWN